MLKETLAGIEWHRDGAKRAMLEGHWYLWSLHMRCIKRSYAHLRKMIGGGYFGFAFM